MSLEIDFGPMLKTMEALERDLTDKHVVQAMREDVADLKVASVALIHVDTHTAEKSAYSRVTATPNKIVGEVGFTAQAEDGYPYVPRLHEDLTLGVGPKTEQKPAYDGMEPGAKFLSRPAEKYRDKYVQNLADGVSKAIEEAMR